ncbi:MAG TPA: type II toxin-antitoxin system RelE/ParE family toxin [Bacilli bacterium]
MENYKLLIFPSAKQDLQEIVDYVNELSVEAAFKLYDDIAESIGSLLEMPMRCPLMKSTALRAKGYRVLIINNYLVFYVVNGEMVEIRRILYKRRQYASLL